MALPKRPQLAGLVRHPLTLTLLLAAAAIGLAMLCRYEAIEPRPIGVLCRSVDPAWWCAPREWLLWSVQNQLLGIAGVLAAVVGIGGGRLAFGRLAAAFGGLALFLYQAELGALALLLALLRSLRP